LAPQNLSSDKHVDVCADSDEDRGSTPLASSLIGKSPWVGVCWSLMRIEEPTWAAFETN
jgi:hypothetical protein